MSSILAAILIVLALYYVLGDPIKFLFLYGVTAAYNEARGIEGFLSSGVIPYTSIMQYLLFLVFLRCVFRKHKINNNARTILLCSGIYILLVTVSCVTGRHILSIPVYLAQNCPIYIVILYTYKDKVDIKDFVIRFLTFHIVMAFLIIYLPVFGINILEPVQGYKYIDSTYAMGSPATLGNFYKVFSYKYTFNLSAQFHNPNDTAFFGVIGVAIYFSLLKKQKKIKWLFLMGISVMLWVNGGSRTALIGLVMGFFATFVLARHNSKKVLVLFVGIVLTIIMLSMDTVQAYVFSLLGSRDYGSIYTSIIGRVGLRDGTIELIKCFPVFGTGGELGSMSISNINLTQYAHELPLRQAALFGIPVGIISFLTMYAVPLVYIIKNKKYDLVSMSLYFILLCSTMSNGFLCPMMAYLIVYICVLENNKSKIDNIYKVARVRLRFR